MTVVRANRRARRRLRRDARVSKLERDRPRYLQGSRDSLNVTLAALQRQLQSGSEQTPYGVNLHGGVLGHGYDNPNRVRVCIIDSGYDRTHPDLEDDPTRVASHQGSDAFNDPCGHGTHVAGTVTALTGNGIGVTAVGDTNVQVVKVFSGSDCGWSWGSSLATAVDACVAAGSRVITMSLGGGSPLDVERQSFAAAEANNVLSIAAAGNSGNTQLSYPASYDAVMSVAAVDSNKNVASFSQRNAQVEISGAGVGVLSTTSGGGYASWSGTSMATPHVAAIAGALMTIHPDATAVEVREAITSTAEDLGAAGRDNVYGFGLARGDLANDYLSSCSRSDPTIAVSAPTTADCSSPFSVTIDVTNNDAVDCTTVRPTSVFASSDTTAGVSFAFQAPVTGTPILTNSFELVMKADNYAAETSWTLEDAAGTTVFSGSLTASDNGDERVFEYNDVSFSSADDLTFTVKDSYGDGMCCSYGHGQYMLKMDGTTVASGADFGDADTTEFAPVGAAGGIISDPVSIASSQTVLLDVDAASYEGLFEVEVTTTMGSYSTTTALQVTCSGTTDPPADPTALSVTAFTDTTVTVSWTDNADNEANYYVKANGGTATQLAANTQSHTVTGLSENSPNTIAVYASNGVGNSATLSVSQKTRYSAPSGVAVKAGTISQDQLELEWDGKSGAAFGVEMSSGGGGWAAAPGGPAGPTGQVVTPLTAGTAYSFRVSATNSNGDASAPSATVTATTLLTPPGTPVFTKSEAGVGMTVELEWNDVSGEARYVLTRDPSFPASGFDGHLDADSTSFLDDAVDPATEYTYELTAYAADDTPSSGAATATVLTLAACEPSPATATSASEDVTVECIAGETISVDVTLANNDGITCGDSKLSMSAVLADADATAGYAVSFGADAVDITSTGGGGSGTSTLHIVLKTDNYPLETAYSVVDSAGTAHFAKPVKFFTDAGTVYTFDHDLDNALSPWTFILTDSFSDGTCCGYGYGGLELTYRGNTKVFTNTELNFGATLSHELEAVGQVVGSATAEATFDADTSTTVPLSITIPAGGLPASETVISLAAYHGPHHVVDPDSTSTLKLTCGSPTAPPATDFLTATRNPADLQGTIDLTWTDVAGDAGYEVQYEATASVPVSGDWSGSATFTTDSDAGPVSGLSANTEYSFRIRSLLGVGGIASAWSSPATTASTAPDAPVDAANFAATLTTPASSQKIALQWDEDDVSGSRPVTGYTLELSVDGGAFAEVSPAPTTNLYIYADTPTPESTYTFRLTLANDGGLSNPVQTSITIPAVCTYAAPQLTVSVTGPTANLPCNKVRQYEVAATITSAHHAVCGAEDFSTELTGVSSGYAVCNDFEMHVIKDLFPAEFSFAVHDGSDASGPLLWAGNADVPATPVTLCPSSGQVFFSITDAGGDGLCCGHGVGSYAIYQQGSSVYNSAVDTPGGFTSASATHTLAIDRTASASLTNDGTSSTATWSIVTSSSSAGDLQVVATSQTQSTTETANLDVACNPVP